MPARYGVTACAAVRRLRPIGRWSATTMRSSRSHPGTGVVGRPPRGDDGEMATRTRPVLRWAVPAGLAAVAVGGSLLAPAIAAAEPDLPDVTAAELLAGLRTEPVEGFSGTVVHRADLGLPTIPGLTGSRG